MPLIAGQGVDLIKEIKPAGEIIREMMTEAALTLSSVATL
jgi:NAD(P)H-dependent flavin oxidoreductase YrpB (nitropropane dioxygenase family)